MLKTKLLSLRQPRAFGLLLSFMTLALLACPVALRAQGTGFTAAPPAPNSAAATSNNVRGWARSLFWSERWDDLEKYATDLRTSKAAFADGTWKLASMYDGLGNISGHKPEADAVWIGKMHAWVKARPQSITARVALAELLTTYAWAARGSGYADTLTTEGYQLFEERLAEARLVLREAKKLSAKCPHWWDVAQTIALGQGWPMKAYEDLFKEAITFEPDYYTYYENKNIFLLPRWYGEEGDTQRFSLQAANRMGGDKGNILYARLMWDLYPYEPEQMAGPLTSYDKMSAGFAILDKQFSNDIGVKAAWARACWMAGDAKNEDARKKQARLLIDEIDEIDPRPTAPWRLPLEEVRLWSVGKGQNKPVAE